MIFYVFSVRTEVNNIQLSGYSVTTVILNVNKFSVQIESGIIGAIGEII